VVVVDDSIIDAGAAPKVNHDESAIYPRLHIECNENPLTAEVRPDDECGGRGSSRRRFQQREESLDLKSKTIIVAPPAGPPDPIARPSITEARSSTSSGRSKVPKAAAAPLFTPPATFRSSPRSSAAR
jgi:hypothetical protein